jgi:hypothetical protein
LGCGGRQGAAVKLFDLFRSDSERDRFAKLITGRLMKAGYPRPSYDSQAFKLSVPGGADIWLWNAMKAWKRAPKNSKEREIEVLLGSLAEGEELEPFETLSAKLLPMVRSRAQLAAWTIDPEVAMDGLADVTAAFCESMAIGIGIDRPSSIQHVGGNQLTGWSRSFDEALSIAIENIRSRSPCKFERMDGGFFLSDYGDFWDASRILLPHLFEQLDLAGDPVAVVMEREAVVVAGSDDRAALNAMAEYVEAELPQADRPVSYRPIMLHQGAWRPMDTSRDGLEALDRLRALEILSNCQLQQKVLEDHLHRQGRDVYVALVDGIRCEGRLKTYSVTTDVDTLFAEVDAVGLELPGDRRFAVSWRDFVAICGPFQLEPDVFPDRFLMRWGTAQRREEQLAQCEPVSWLCWDQACDVRPTRGKGKNS